MAMREPSGLELAEDIRELTRAVQDLAMKMDSRFDSLSNHFLPREVYEAYHRALRDEVARIDSRMTWIGRAAVTGLLFPVLVAIIVALVLVLGGPT